MHYHLIGICGTAMASLAGMLQARGHKVTGSDQNVYPPMSTQLEALGIEILNGYKTENADIGADCVVVGNAISRGNPELEEVLSRKMLYRSQAEIVNNIEFDHADIYRDLQEIKFQFSRLMNLVPGNGRLIVGIDSPVARDVLDEMQGKLFTTVETFGLSDDAKWQARYIDFTGDTTRFTVFKDGHSWGEMETHLIGEFNVRNCLAVIIAADAWGISQEKIQEAFHSFKSVKRRVEVRGEIGGVTVIDDFAHHPTAVEETLKALRMKYDGRRLIAVFEPRSWSSRLAIFQEPYGKAFSYADYVIIAGVYNTSAASELGKVLDTEELVKDIELQGKPAMSFPDADAIVEHLAPEMKEGDVVAIMSNGGFGGIHEKLLSVL